MNDCLLYATAGSRLLAFTLDSRSVALEPLGDAVPLPEGGQFACVHPRLPRLYVVSSNGRPGVHGDRHFLDAFARADDGALRSAGASRQLPQRPIHVAVHPHGRFLLVAYPFPGLLQVWRLDEDGSILDDVPQRPGTPWGHVVHQVAFGGGASPALLLVTRGNDAKAGAPEDPGALLVFDFEDGIARLRQKVAPRGGHGFGPRNLAFHPSGRWAHVSLERQHAFCVFEWDGQRLGDAPLFTRAVRSHAGPPRPVQYVGPVACHPDGRTTYLTNRNDGTERIDGVDVFNGGENTIAVFRIDPAAGEPTVLQHIDSQGLHPRTFEIDPGGTVLVAANTTTGVVRDGDGLRRVASGLSLFRIEDDGRLRFVRKHDVDAAPDLLFWMGIVAHPSLSRQAAPNRP